MVWSITSIVVVEPFLYMVDVDQDLWSSAIRRKKMWVVKLESLKYLWPISQIDILSSDALFNLLTIKGYGISMCLGTSDTLG